MNIDMHKSLKSAVSETFQEMAYEAPITAENELDLILFNMEENGDDVDSFLASYTSEPMIESWEDVEAHTMIMHDIELAPGEYPEGKSEEIIEQARKDWEKESFEWFGKACAGWIEWKNKEHEKEIEKCRDVCNTLEGEVANCIDLLEKQGMFIESWNPSRSTTSFYLNIINRDGNQYSIRLSDHFTGGSDYEIIAEYNDDCGYVDILYTDDQEVETIIEQMGKGEFS